MEIDTKATITLKRSFGKMLLILPVLVAFLLGAYFMPEKVLVDEDVLGFELTLGTICIFLICALGALWLLEVVRNPVLKIEIGPEGIWDRRVSENYLPWAKIRRINTKAVHGTDFLLLEFDKDFESELKPQWRYALSMSLNRLFGEKSHYIDAYGFGVEFDEFLHLVETYASTYGSPAASTSD
ncbi:hypothetical protein [Roseibium sp.]|uniref:hypothetical protein n=1 Tax=Roseibium sp. TaxID=1936156 RepID=UPI003B5054DE